VTRMVMMKGEDEDAAASSLQRFIMQFTCPRLGNGMATTCPLNLRDSGISMSLAQTENFKLGFH